MFDTRLKILASVLAICAAAIIGRLIELQVINGDAYRQQADQILLKPAEALPCVRGRILERGGGLLAWDEPAWDVCVDYDILAMDKALLRRRVADFARRGRYGPGTSREEVERCLRTDIDQMWRDLATLSSEPVADLREHAGRIAARVAAIRQAVAARRGFEETVREERRPHAVLEGLQDQEQIAARLALDAYPWVSVRSGVRRRYTVSAAMAHLLGRMARVSPDDIESDAGADDPLRRLGPDESVGRSGVEWAAQRRLRGSRGELLRNRNDDVLARTAAIDGQDVRLTIRGDLQERLYAELQRSLAAMPALASGGAVVVLDVPSRELLALVSYPGYDANRFAEQYADLRGDTRHMPLRFRAVSNRYAPGSIVKPLTCLAGLASGLVARDTVFHCYGSLDPQQPRKLRCWEPLGSDTRRAHGDQVVEEAITHSCNVFMYHVGAQLGVARLTGYFGMAGLGRPAGTDLREESWGLNPTPAWLAQRASSADAGHAMNFAVGQGELLVTPVQAANLMAVYASGVYRPVALVKGLSPSPEWRLPGRADDWSVIRHGMYRVVNDPEGTAYRYARLEGDARFCLCGKTGSATVKPWPTAWRIDFRTADERDTFAVVPAGDAVNALEEFRAAYPGIEPGAPPVVAERWPNVPAEQGEHAHAWFAGYLQALDTLRQPDWDRSPRIAFAILVEFGGSGGRVAGPIAQRVARTIIDVLGPELDLDPNLADGGDSRADAATPASARSRSDGTGRDGARMLVGAPDQGD